MAHVLGRLRVLQLPRELRPPRCALLPPLVLRLQDRLYHVAPAPGIPRKSRNHVPIFFYRSIPAWGFMGMGAQATREGGRLCARVREERSAGFNTKLILPDAPTSHSTFLIVPQLYVMILH